MRLLTLRKEELDLYMKKAIDAIHEQRAIEESKKSKKAALKELKEI